LASTLAQIPQLPRHGCKWKRYAKKQHFFFNSPSPVDLDGGPYSEKYECDDGAPRRGYNSKDVNAKTQLALDLALTAAKGGKWKVVADAIQNIENAPQVRTSKGTTQVYLMSDVNNIVDAAEKIISTYAPDKN
jgi:hypothetical protein